MGAIDSASLLNRHRLTVEEYDRMGETSVLAPEARVELIEGEIVGTAPIGARHASVVMRLTRLLVTALGDRAIVSVQSTLRLGPRSDPQPDVMILAPQADFYSTAHPTAADVLLLIEVSDSAARYDREVKLALYARHGVREVWIVDLDHQVLRTFRGPTGDTYTEVFETAHPGLLTSQALPDSVIDASMLLS